MCDDDKEINEKLEQYIKRTDKAHNDNIIVDIYTDSSELYYALEEERKSYDLIILDIIMPKKSGVQIGKLIRNKLNDQFTSIAFISSNTKFAMELFRLQPLDFIIKPIQYKRVRKVIDLAYDRAMINRHKFTFEIQGVEYRIPMSKILFIESNARKLVIHTVDNNYNFYGRLDSIYEELKSYGFIHIHKSYLVNIAHISKIEYEKVQLDTGKILPISKNRRGMVRELWDKIM